MLKGVASAYGSKTMGHKTTARSTSNKTSEQFGKLLARRANEQFLLVEQSFLVTLATKMRSDESSALSICYCYR